MRPFEPLLSNPHLLTIAANFWPRNYAGRTFAEHRRLFPTEPDVQVLGIVQEPTTPPKGEVILLHGLEGSHESGYMRSAAQTLTGAGYRTTRLNMRSCGGTESLCRTLYHAGLTTDLAAVVETYRREGRGPIIVVGYSLGGNVVLKFAGESGESIRSLVAGIVSVSTPIDLAACCRRMMDWDNRLYEWRFITRLKDRYRRRADAFPDLFSLDGLDGVQSVYEFDDRFTASHFGFGDANGYYGSQSSQVFLDRIAVPTLMIQSKDDPLIPFAVYSHPAIAANRHIQLVLTDHGGHVGFISRRSPRFWVDQTILDWLPSLSPPQR